MGKSGIMWVNRVVIEILTEIGFESEDEVREFGVFRCLEG